MKYRLIALVLLASALFGCGTRRGAESDTASGPGFTSDENGVGIVPGSALQAKLKLSVIEPQAVDIQHKATASVGPRSGAIAEIGLPFSGRVIRSFVRLGDQVRQGQILFEVSSSDYMEAVKTYLESQSAANLATANRNRKENLHQSGILSDREWEEVCAEARNAANACELARRSLAIYNVDPSSVQVGEPLRVVSPISGRVVRNDLVIGGFLREEEDAPMTVADLSSVWVTANVRATQAAELAIGQPVQVEIDAEHQAEGRIFYVGDILDEKTRTLPVVIECGNAHRMLKPGMFVTVAFQCHSEAVLAIPSTSVFQGASGKYVYVQDAPGHFKKTQVQVETLEKGLLHVLSGLAAGETIIIDGGIYLSK